MADWQVSSPPGILPELRPSPDTPWRNLSGAQLASWRGDSERALDYGRKVLDVMPWNKGACNLVMSSYRANGQEAAAEAVLAECRDWFPSKYLR